MVQTHMKEQYWACGGLLSVLQPAAEFLNLMHGFRRSFSPSLLSSIRLFPVIVSSYRLIWLAINPAKSADMTPSVFPLLAYSIQFFHAQLLPGLVVQRSCRPEKILHSAVSLADGRRGAQASGREKGSIHSNTRPQNLRDNGTLPWSIAVFFLLSFEWERYLTVWTAEHCRCPHAIIIILLETSQARQKLPLWREILSYMIVSCQQFKQRS